MRLRSLLYSLVALLLLPLTAAQAQRGGPATWELLGQQTVGFGVDNDSIRIGQNEEWYRDRAFRSLRFAAERNDVNLISIRIHYLNGFVEDMQIDRVIRKGGQLDVTLGGERSFLKQIDMRYRASNLGISIGQGGISLQQAVVKVLGERIQRRPEPAPPGPVAGRGWEPIDAKRFDGGEERVIFRADRGEGRFGRIRLRAPDQPVRLRNVVIRFRNGESQTVPINDRLEGGAETQPIDLAGELRQIETVTVNLEPRRRPGSVELQLLGSRRPGGPSAEGGADSFVARGWTMLGEHTVGATIDRDVFEIQQSEEWYRNRAFRALHFVADRADVHVMELRINYLNGFSERFSVDKLFPVGRDVAIDLRGDRSYLRSIEMTYRAVTGGRRQAVVRIYGEPAVRR